MRKRPDNHDNLREEFADVLNYLMELANRFDVNLAEVYFEKHKINQTRQWKIVYTVITKKRRCNKMYEMGIDIICCWQL
ncbi:hypothetical protein KOY49_04185 [Candidatus Minimicrobia vallesae]|uniref:NTP pyrophosphohydrolase MazG putative catalytic core domain-containing protein n=2 Tax=Candidatus Minimicrobia TaxID=2905967 RepID=A0A8F1MB27_9BACT|nr:hypothetical protein [Candidatus Minimicrobia vallesae]QWQ31338.1 hypothetical protein KOY49_04185 [Candidatus Minimicrobia vallesae]